MGLWCYYIVYAEKNKENEPPTLWVVFLYISTEKEVRFVAQGRNQHTKSKAEMMQMGLMAMTPEQRHAARVKGGQASAARYRRMKHMQEIARAVLAMRLRGEDEIREALREGGFKDEDINYAAGVIMSQTFKSLGGDTRAAEFIRDTAGYKPTDGLLVGNLEDKPFETLNLSSLTDAQLQALAVAKSEREDEE